MLFCLLGVVSSPAKAGCLPQEHVTTVYDIIEHYFDRIVGLSTNGVNADATQMWASWNDYYPGQPSFVHDTIQPTFTEMAEQWTMTEMKGLEYYETLSTNKQHKLTEAELQRVQADIMARLQPQEAICSRVSIGGSLLKTSWSEHRNKQQLLRATLAPQLSETGMASSYGVVDAVVSRFDHYQNTGCTEDEMGGAFNGACAITDPERAQFDVDPYRHFGQLTVEENDVSAPGGASDIQSYVQNVCGGKNLSLLPSQYYTEQDQAKLVNDVAGYWQYSAFCNDSIASYAALKAPGSDPLSNEQRAALTEVGYDNNQISTQYGQNPSKQAQIDIMIASQYENPKALGPDQMMSGNGVFAYDTLSLAMETMLLDQYQDIFTQEARNLTLYLGLAIKEQRKKANAGLKRASDRGKKS